MSYFGGVDQVLGLNGWWAVMAAIVILVALLALGIGSLLSGVAAMDGKYTEGMAGYKGVNSSGGAVLGSTHWGQQEGSHGTHSKLNIFDETARANMHGGGAVQGLVSKPQQPYFGATDSALRSAQKAYLGSAPNVAHRGSGNNSRAANVAAGMEGMSARIGKGGKYALAKEGMKALPNREMKGTDEASLRQLLV